MFPLPLCRPCGQGATPRTLCIQSTARSSACCGARAPEPGWPRRGHSPAAGRSLCGVGFARCRLWAAAATLLSGVIKVEATLQSQARGCGASRCVRGQQQARGAGPCLIQAGMQKCARRPSRRARCSAQPSCLASRRPAIPVCCLRARHRPIFNEPRSKLLPALAPGPWPLWVQAAEAVSACRAVPLHPAAEAHGRPAAQRP